MSHYTCEGCYRHYQFCECPKAPVKIKTKKTIRKELLKKELDAIRSTILRLKTIESNLESIIADS
jgi:hypothetical protein